MVLEKKVKPTIFSIMATKYNLSQQDFLDTLLATVMPTGKNQKQASKEEVAAFLMVANKYSLDPFTKEIYAFPSKRGGIVPIVSIDGFVKIMNRQQEFDGYELSYDDSEIKVDGGKAKECPAWAEVKIFHKNREHPTIVREYLDEVYVSAESKGGFKGPWQTHTKRMLRHKVLIQSIRIAFGVTGIYDPDEGERIIEAQVTSEVTHKPEVEMPSVLGSLASFKEITKQPDNVQDNVYKNMLEQFADAKKIVGDTVYYNTLKQHGYAHANGIRKIDKGNEILNEFNKYIDKKNA